MSVAATAPTLTLTRTAGQFAFHIGGAVTNANNYKLEQDIVNTFTNPTVYNLPTAPLTGSRYTVTGLTEGTTYYFRIRAERTTAPISNSNYSVIVSNVFANVPSQVGTVTPTPGNVSVSLSWSAPSTGGSAITGYKIERSTDNATWTSVIASTTTNPYNVTSLTNGMLYYFRISAINALGTGTASASVSTTPRTIPGQPTGVSASVTSATSVNVSFTAPASNGGNAITNYIVTPYIGATAQATTSGNSSPISVTGLTTGQAYTFKVHAVNAAGNGTLSAATSSVSLVYDAVSAPSGATFTYASGIATNTSKVTYTGVSFSDVTITPTGSAWTVVASGQTDTLNGVRKIVLTDKIVYLAGSGANTGTVSGSSTVGSYTMSNTNAGGKNYIGAYVTDALAEYTATTKAAVIYLAGDTIYTPSSNPDINVRSPLSIIGITLNSKKPLVSRFNQDLRFIMIRNSNVRIENVIFDLYMTSPTEVNAGSIDIGFVNTNLTLLENITFKDVDMVRGYKKGVNMNYVSNVTFDGCTFARVTDRATIGMTSAKNVTIKNCTIPRSGANQLNWGSIYINSSNGPRDIYRLSTPTPPSFNANRDNWTDEQKLAAVKTENIDLSLNNTFTDEAGVGTAMIHIDTYKVENGALQYSLTYRGASPNVLLPSGFGYAFTHDAAAGVTIPKVYITKNSSDITSVRWGFDPTNVTVRRLDTNARIYPDGYELANNVFDNTTLSTETEIPIKIGGARTIVPIRAPGSLSGLTSLAPVFVTGESANPKLAVFTSGDPGAAVKNAIDNSIGSVVVQRTIKGSTKASTIDVKKRSAVSSVVATKTVGGQAQTATADITSLPPTYSVILSVDDIDGTAGLKANVFFKVVDGNGTLVTSGLNIPIDFDVPGTEAVSALDLYRYDTNTADYVKLGVANKKAGTSTTFSYTFTTNSDYQLRTQAGGGGGAGDPYIKTLSGELYKLPSFNGFLRLYQGNVNGKTLTVNAQTRIDDDVHSMDTDTLAFNKKLTTPVEEEKLRMKSAMSFFERVYIHYDNTDMVVNIMDGFRIEKDGFNVQNVGHIHKYLSGWKIYEHLNGNIYNIQVTPDVSIRIGIIPIKSIRNSVEIMGVRTGNGAIMNKLSAKAMSLKKLTDKKEVEQKEYNVRRHIPEVFVCNETKHSINIPYIG